MLASFNNGSQYLFSVSVTTLDGVYEVDSFKEFNRMLTEMLGLLAAPRLLRDNKIAVILSGVQMLHNLTYS